MHDLDRALREFEAEADEFEMSDDEGDYEFEFESADDREWDGEYAGELDGEYDDEFEAEFEDELAGEFEADYETEQDGEYDDEFEAETVFDEVEEMELAGNLLEIDDEEEMEQFIGRLLKKAWKTARKVARSPEGSALAGVLKSMARKILPAAGAALGNLALPGVGGVAGTKLLSAAEKAFGLELEGMTPQDREFEVARRFVRLASAAAQEVAENPTGSTAPDVAKNAVLTAARRYAPGLVVGVRPNGNRSVYVTPHRVVGGVRGGQRMSGRWIRRGRRIILFGL